MIPYPPVGPLWGSEIPATAEILEEGIWRGARKHSRSRDPGGRRLESTKICPCRCFLMIFPPTVGPLWDSEIQRELRSCLRWYLPCGLSVCLRWYLGRKQAVNKLLFAPWLALLALLALLCLVGFACLLCLLSVSVCLCLCLSQEPPRDPPCCLCCLLSVLSEMAIDRSRRALAQFRS